MGWSLRQHSRVNPQWVINFVNDHPDLSNLSQKEALRLILK
ncbi:DNA alkylation repair protein [Flavobacteriales bacterium]|nr:DNA alkylation repair protein [Flavobacteriales bacterium]